jgi:hypothetical protein
MPEQDDDNGNGFPTENETKIDEQEEVGIAPDRPEDDEGFPTAPEA